MASTTVKYVLRSDRKQMIDVKSPLFGVAAIVGSDGKVTEMARSKLDELYEPLLAPASPKGVDLSVPGGKGAQQLAAIESSVAELHAKVDKILAVVVPPHEPHAD